MKCYAVCDEEKGTDAIWFLMFVDVEKGVFDMYRLEEDTNKTEIIEITFDDTFSVHDALENMKAKHGESYV